MIGSTPFVKQFERKMSPKLAATTQRNTDSSFSRTSRDSPPS